MPLRSMTVLAEHDCDENAKVDTDLCTECGEHAGFCETCGLSSCCGVKAADTDYEPAERDE